LTLRKALHKILSEGEFREVLWRRWRFQQTRMNREAGLIFNETEWAKEWDEIVALASPEPRNNKNSARRRSMILERQSSLSCAESIDTNATYDSLEEIHVLALSYVLRRPIIVISDNILRDINGEALAPITFGGIYLPLDISPLECHKVPLLLAYDTAHFSALVTMETTNEIPPALIPLIDNENILIPIQYPIDPGNNFDWQTYDGREGQWALTDVEHIALLKEYLEISYASPAISPDEEIYNSNESDEEYDKKILDMAINLNNEENNFAPPNGFNSGSGNGEGSSSSPEFEGKQKSKSAAKLQSVAKQFGSLGRSMSKKIKKNIGSITKLGKKDHKFPNINTMTQSLGGGFVNGRYRFLCAQLRARRHDFQEEMIKNYLDCAYQRFIHQPKDSAAGTFKIAKDHFMNSSPLDDRVVHCINTDCDNFGTEKTSYLCVSCYEKQKQRETMTTDDNVDFQSSAAR
jgi:OTU domain-containing protein 7